MLKKLKGRDVWSKIWIHVNDRCDLCYDITDNDRVPVLLLFGLSLCCGCWQQLPPCPRLWLLALYNNTCQVSQKKSTGATPYLKFSASLLCASVSHSCSLPGNSFSSPWLVPVDPRGLFPWILSTTLPGCWAVLSFGSFWRLSQFYMLTTCSALIGQGLGGGLPSPGMNSDM